MRLKLYKFQKLMMQGNPYYNVRIPREIAESYPEDQLFIIEKDSDSSIVIKPATITTA